MSVLVIIMWVIVFIQLLVMFLCFGSLSGTAFDDFFYGKHYHLLFPVIVVALFVFDMVIKL